MRAPLVRTMLVTIAVVSIVSVAHAQMEGGMEGSSRMVSFGIGGGVAVPVSDARDAFKTGFNGQGFVRLNLKQLPIAPRVDFTFSKFDIDDAKLAVPGASGNGQIFAGVANVQYFVMPAGPVRPYVVAGLGVYNFKTDVTGIPNASNTDTRFGVNGGAGLVVKLGSLVSGYVEGRLDNVFSQKGLIKSDQVQVIPVTFGVVF